MIRSIVGTVALTLILAAGAATGATATPWDQEKVTGLVKELRAVVAEIQVTEKSVDDPALVEARAQVVEELALLRHNLRYLEQLLAKGEDREHSWPFAKYCENLIERVRRTAAKLPVLPEQEANVGKAEALIAEIGGYYGADAPDVAAPSSGY
jgi:hypothetical protein